MLRRKFALSEEGFASFKKGVVSCVVANLLLMAPVAVFYLVTEEFLVHAADASAPLPQMWVYGLAIAGVLAALFVSQLIEYDNTYCIVYEESARKRISIGERLRRLPLSFFGQRDLSDLTTVIMKDCADQERMFSHVVPQLFGAGISTLIISVMLFAYDWQLAAAALWPVPVALAVLLLSTRRQGRAIARKNACGLAVADGIQEYLECNREIRSCKQTEAFLADLDDRIAGLERAKFRSEITAGVFVSSMQAFLRMGLASTILVGAAMVVSGECELLVFFGFMLVVTRVYDPIGVVFISMAELLDMLFSLDRMREVEEHAIQEGSAEFAPQGHDISFEDVSFSYAGEEGEQVLSGISFVAKEGEVTALVGPSGGGKSTVAKLAARFWDLQGGVVRVGGVDVSTVDPETLLSDYAMVFQDVVLFNASVMDNIRLGRRGASDEEVRAAASAAMCDEFASRLPQGYDTMIGENGSRLSGGERQRISIARALLKDAPIVLLDEATASLDVENETQVQHALSRLLAGKTVLVIAHRMRTIENADKVVVLAEGKVVEQGAPSELLARGGAFARMVRLQKESAAWTL